MKTSGFEKCSSLKQLQNDTFQAVCFFIRMKDLPCLAFLLAERQSCHAIHVIMNSINRLSRSAERKQKFDKFYIRYQIFLWFVGQQA